MNYSSGETVEIGDSVSLEHGKTPGIVYAVIESSQQVNDWALSEPGIMLETEPFGLVFWPASEIYDPVFFVARKCT